MRTRVFGHRWITQAQVISDGEEGPDDILRMRGFSISAHFVHVRRHFPAQRSPIEPDFLCGTCITLCCFITKTYLYKFGPLKPHFYIVKLGFTGVYIIFLISAQNKDCGFSLEPPCRGGSNEYPQSMFLSRNVKKIRIFVWKFSVFGGEILYIFE